jgi:hypothetical protein
MEIKIVEISMKNPEREGVERLKKREEGRRGGGGMFRG